MDREPVSTCTQLVRGDIVEAYLGPALQFTGRVTEVLTELELFWAVDSIGHRRLFDLGSYNVYRLGPTLTCCPACQGRRTSEE